MPSSGTLHVNQLHICVAEAIMKVQWISCISHCILGRCAGSGHVSPLLLHLTIRSAAEHRHLSAQGASICRSASALSWCHVCPCASLGSSCFLVYLSPLQSLREDNLSDMPHLVYSQPLKSYRCKLWGGMEAENSVEESSPGMQQGVRDMYKILNDIVARNRQG